MNHFTKNEPFGVPSMSDAGKQPRAVIVGVGAEKGLGAALGRRFAAGGHHVLLAGRTRERIERVAAAIEMTGGRVTAVPTDATREADVVQLFDLSVADGGDLDVIVFNAGNNRQVGLLDLGAAEFEEFWRGGCFAGFLVARDAARRPATRPRGRGTVIFTGASASLRGRPGYAHFAAAKSGLRAIARSYVATATTISLQGTVDMTTITLSFQEDTGYGGTACYRSVEGQAVRQAKLARSSR